MKRKSIKVLMIALCIVLALIVAASGNSTPHNTRYVLSSSASGGVWYTMGGGLGAMWNELLPWPMDVMASSGGVENVVRAQFKDTDIWFSHTSHMAEARAGVGTAADFAPNGDLLILSGVYPSSFYFVALYESGIRSMSDLAGKSVILGPPGGSTTDNSRRMLMALGLYDQITASEMALGDAARALQDGLVDVIGVGGHPAPAVAEIAQMRDVWVIPFNDEELETIFAIQPYFFKSHMEAGVYPGQSNPVPLTYFYAWLCVGAWVPEDVVYDALTAMFSDEGRRLLRTVHPRWGQMSMAEEEAYASNLVFHPAALRFFNANPQYKTSR